MLLPSAMIATLVGVLFNAFELADQLTIPLHNSGDVMIGGHDRVAVNDLVFVRIVVPVGRFPDLKHSPPNNRRNALIG